MSKIKYVITKNANELKTLINETIGYAKTMQEKVQICAVAILAHAEKHGDWTKANDLVLGLPNGVKRDSLVAYFEQNGGLISGEEGFVAWSGADKIRKQFNDAKTKMWWTYKVKSPFAGFDLNNEIEKLIEKAQKRLNDRTNWMDGDSDKKKADAAKIQIDINRLDALRDVLKSNVEETEVTKKPEDLQVKMAENADAMAAETKALGGHYQPVANAA